MTLLRHLASAWPRAAASVCAAMLVFASAMSVATRAAAEPPPWPDSPFSYLGKEQQLDKVLAGFARTFGLQLRLDGPLPEDLGALSGRSAAASPTEFLNQLSASYGLTWYYHAGAIYVSRSSERVTRLLPTKGMSAGALRKAFTEMGIFEQRFGWGEVEERSAVMISGPRSYVERIERAMSTFPEPVAEQQIMVFRLKHAAVDDRTIQYRDKQIVTPGVASMLRALLGDGSGVNTLGTVMEQGDSGSMRNLRPLVDDRPAAQVQGQTPAAQQASAATPPRTPERGRLPRAIIQADSRLNAIIIKDKPQNAPLYKELIDTLDVPSNLIEIEAAIVDVNSSNMKELGIDWSGRTNKAAFRFGDATQSTDSATLTLIRGGGANPTTVIADAAKYLLARISALETKGQARIVSRPFILTQDNMGALIDMSDTFYVQTAGQQVATVTAVSVGVTLRVTPRIVFANGVRAVQLVVDIEDGLIQDTKVGALPTVRRSTIGTQAVMGENESLLIGGFNTERSFNDKEQVPVLGDVPLLGAAFRKSATTAEKSERLFLITPKIVADRFNQAAALVPAPAAVLAPAAPAPAPVAPRATPETPATPALVLTPAPAASALPSATARVQPSAAAQEAIAAGGELRGLRSERSLGASFHRRTLQ